MSKAGATRRYAARTMKASEFKAKCLSTMDEVQERGIEVVITKRGIPIAKLVPADGSLRSPIGFMRGTVLDQEDIVAPDHDAWRLEDDE